MGSFVVSALFAGFVCGVFPFSRGRGNWHTQFTKFLQCNDNNILMQVVEELTRRRVMPDIVLMNKGGLVKEAALAVATTK